MANKYNNDILPLSEQDVQSSFAVNGAVSDEFDNPRPRGFSALAEDFELAHTYLVLEDITSFYPSDLDDVLESPGGVPTSSSPWGRVTLQFTTGEIVLVNGFEIISGTKGKAYVEVIEATLARGLLNTTAIDHSVREQVYAVSSSMTLMLALKAIQKIQTEIHAFADHATGHDHSGSYKGKQIPAAGLATGSVLPSKLSATNAPSTGTYPKYNGTNFTWDTPDGGDTPVSSAFRLSFEDADLVGGVLEVTHDLGEEVVLVQVYDNNNKLVIPDEVELVDNTTLNIDLQSFDALSGTWNIIVQA